MKVGNSLEGKRCLVRSIFVVILENGGMELTRLKFKGKTIFLMEGVETTR